MVSSLYKQVLRNNFLKKYNNFINRLHIYHCRNSNLFSMINIQMKSIECLLSKQYCRPYPFIYRYPHTPFSIFHGNIVILPSSTWVSESIENRFQNTTCINLIYSVLTTKTLNINMWYNFFRGHKLLYYEYQNNIIGIYDRPTNNSEILTSDIYKNLFTNATHLMVRFFKNIEANKNSVFSYIYNPNTNLYLNDMAILFIQAANVHPFYTASKPSDFLNKTKDLNLYRESYYTNSNNIHRIQLRPSAKKLIFYTKYKKFVFKDINVDIWFDLCAMLPYSNTDIIYRLTATRIDNVNIEVPSSTFLPQDKVSKLFFSKTSCHPYLYPVKDDDYLLSLEFMKS